MPDNSFVVQLMSRGLASNLAKRVANCFSDWEHLSAASHVELAGIFKRDELEEIRKAKKRREIPHPIVSQLIDECELRCCLCWNIDIDSGVVIHHIRPHSVTPNDSYENLIALCPDHHSKVHTNWELVRHPYPPELLIRRKADFISAIAAFKSGNRPAPGREKDVEASVLLSLPPPSPHFCGRNELLRLVREELTKPNSRVALVGMGGVGKSAMIIESANQCRDEFPGGILCSDIGSECDGCSSIMPDATSSDSPFGETFSSSRLAEEAA